MPRLAGLALSPDGAQLVTAVATLDADGTKWQTSLWAIDPAGTASPRRLTRSAPGESAPVFAPDGSLLFTSKRVDPDAGTSTDDVKPALWSLPPDGGEARLVTSHPAGIDGVAVAHDSGDVAIVASMASGATDPESDPESPPSCTSRTRFGTGITISAGQFVTRSGSERSPTSAPTPRRGAT